MSLPPTNALFASDLHGSRRRFDALFATMVKEAPAVVLLGGDLLPSGLFSAASDQSFVDAVLAPGLDHVRRELGPDYPAVVAIPGNDDGRFEERELLRAQDSGLLRYLVCARMHAAGRPIYGYPFIPPSPFRIKDWERYDVSRFVDPGCVAPEDGATYGDPVFPSDLRHPTIADDLVRLTADDDVERAVFVFHAPPYDCPLDRAALDGKTIDHCPLDVHIGSIAIRRFIEEAQPCLTLHGHVHESARLTGAWRHRFGRTWALSAAHDGPELALVRIPLDDPASATRELI